MKLFPTISLGCENILRAIFMGYETILVKKNFDENIRMREKIYRHLEMMNHLNCMKIARDNLVSFHRSVFVCTETSGWEY